MMRRLLYALLGLALANASAFGAGKGGANRQEPVINSARAGSASALHNYVAVSASPGVTMSGATNSLSGTSGRGLVNIVGWFISAGNVFSKIGQDVTPTCGPTSCAWTLNFDVTALPAGAQSISVIGYSAPNGANQFISNQINFPITVSQAVAANISYIGASAASSAASSGATCAPAVPTGTQPGDLILGYVANEVNAAGNTPAGWNIANVAGANVQAINTIQSATLYYRFATGAAADAPSFTNLSFPACGLRTYRGVSATAPFDSWTQCVQTSATSCALSTFGNTANANEVAVAFYDFNINTATITGPAGFGNAAIDQTQRSMWSGDKTIVISGTAPGVLTATASPANYWDAVGITLNATGGAPTVAAPAITTQPQPVSVTAGQTAIFTAAASGNPTPTWQWQQSSDNGLTWQNAWGASTGSSYTTLSTAPADGVNAAGLEFGSNFPGTLNIDYFLTSQAELAYYAGKGLKLFRLPFSWERIQPNGVNTAIDQTYLGYLKTFLASAAAVGGTAILDNHNGGSYFNVKLGQGTVTGAALANVWSQIATAVKGLPGLGGYDIMNEPNGFATGTEWPTDAQLVVTAIRAVDTVTPIYMEGDCVSAAWNWGTSCNTTINTVVDPFNNMIFSAHQYFDANSSGQYAACAPPDTPACENIDPVKVLGSVSPFISWLAANHQRGLLGEYSVPDNPSSGWNPILDAILTQNDQNCVSGTYWAGGPGWGADRMAIEPISGVDRPQMAVVAAHVGTGACFNGYKYRAVATNSQGSATSAAVALTVTPVVSSGGPTAAAPCTGAGGWGTGNCGTATQVSTNAVRVNDFLNSTGFVIGGGGSASCASGVCATTQNYIDMFNYVGTRNVRGISSVDTAHLPSNFGIQVCQAANVRFSYGIESGVTLSSSSWASSEIPLAKQLAAATNSFGDSCLLAGEGPNEPDNWCLIYNGVQGGGGGQCGTWLPVAQMQRDFYAAWKANPVLKNYPMFHLSHNGGESSNAGVQFLTVPTGAGTQVADGTAFADYANVHNYESSNGTADNGAWFAADAIQHEIVVCGNNQCDMFHSDYIQPWRLWQGGNHVSGMDVSTAYTIPKVATETGLPDNGDGGAGQGRVLLNIWLAQYKLGYKYTFIYQLRDNEGGFNNTFGVFVPNLSPKTSATIIKNFTTILADRSSAFAPGSVPYTIANEPATVHDLLMQKSNGHMWLAVWDERPIGEATDNITVNFGGSHTGNVYNPIAGTGVQSTFNSATLNLAMTDHPVLIELTDTSVTQQIAAPAISQQPQAVLTNVGQAATFTAAASGNPAPTWQWQISADNGVTWANATGVSATTSAYTTPALTYANNNNQYRAKATNSQGVATTNAATLTLANVFTPIDGTYNLVFDDEFNGAALDTTIWQPNWFGSSDTALTGPINSNELQCYDPAQVSVSGGSLRLTSIASSCNPGGGTYAYRSGIARERLYPWAYGYFESRMFIPAASAGVIANWPAFWMNGQNWPTDGEIDIMEGISGQNSTTFHNAANASAGYTLVGSGDNTGWHVFAVWWQPTFIKWYIDGILVHTLTNPPIAITGAPMELIFNLAVGGAGGPIQAPSTVLADYVHAYQQGGTAVTPQTGYGGPGDNGGTSSPTNFQVTAPAQNANVAGVASVSGINSSFWVNITCWFGTTKVCVDAAPVCVGSACTFSLSLNTNLIPNGSQTVIITGYHDASGNPGTQTSVNLQLNVNNIVISSGTFDQFGLPNPPPAPNNQTAVPVIAWLYSLGANTCGNAGSHCNSSDTAAPPGTGSVAGDQAQIQFTGIHYIRPNGGTYDTNFVINTIQPIGAKIGWQWDYRSGNVGTADINAYYIPVAKQFDAAGVLGFVEGADEPDNFGFFWNGGHCGGCNGAGCSLNSGSQDFTACAQFMHDIYAAYKADSILSKYFVAGITNTGTQKPDCGMEYITSAGIPASAGTLCGFAPGTKFADGGAYHPYQPGSDSNNPNESWFSATPWQSGLPTGAITAGYEYLANSPRYGGGSFSGGLTQAQLQDVIHTIRITTEWNVPETGGGGTDIVGIHQMNALIDYFLRGSKVQEIYSMCGNGVAPGMGFYAGGTFCGAAFPAGNYIHSMTHFLADAGDVPAPPTVNFTYSGCPNDTTSVGEQECHFLFLAKSAQAVYHPNSNVLVATFEPPCGNNSCSYSPINLALNFNQQFAHVNVFDATTVVTPAQNAPSNPTPITGCSACSAITINGWGAFGHSSGAPPPLFIEFYNDNVTSAPVIQTGQPADQTASVGTTVVFPLSIGGNPAPTCEAFKNGVSIGATSCAQLTYPASGSLTLADNGAAFFVKATNSQGIVTSRTATLTVQAAPANTFTINSPAQNATVSGSNSPIVIGLDPTPAWLNSTCWYGDVKVCVDAQPVCAAGVCTISLGLNTTLLPNGTQTIQITGYSTPPGVGGFTSTTVNLTVNVNNAVGTFSLAGHSFTNPTFHSTFPNLSRIAGNVNTANSSLYDWYSSQNVQGPGYGAVICCGTGLVGVDNTSAGCGLASGHNPYSIDPGGNGLVMSYWSGCGTATMQTVATDGTGFRQQYGYFEITAKMPSGPSVWPAFWMLNGLNNWAQKIPGSNQATNAYENDFFEFYGNSCPPVNMRWSLHDWTRAGADVWGSVDQGAYGPTEITYPAPSDYSTAYHKYGVVWDSNQMTWYIDRVQVMQRPTPPVFKDIGYIVVQLGMNACGIPLANATNPTQFFVKDVVVYQLDQ